MNFQEVWRSFYGERVPIAYLLREAQTPHWLRVHSLPESRRYPRDEEEMGEVLRRQGIVAGELLAGAPCLLFFPDFARPLLRPRRGHWLCRYSEDGVRITMFCVAAQWNAPEFASLLRAVANDKVSYVSWMNTRNGEIFAPYDGGADLFVRSSKRRQELRARYGDWLSKHPAGV